MHNEAGGVFGSQGNWMNGPLQIFARRRDAHNPQPVYNAEDTMLADSVEI